jgi:hypothetical protein
LARRRFCPLGAAACARGAAARVRGCRGVRVGRVFAQASAVAGRPRRRAPCRPDQSVGDSVGALRRRCAVDLSGTACLSVQALLEARISELASHGAHVRALVLHGRHCTQCAAAAERRVHRSLWSASNPLQRRRPMCSCRRAPPGTPRSPLRCRVRAASAAAACNRRWRWRPRSKPSPSRSSVSSVYARLSPMWSRASGACDRSALNLRTQSCLRLVQEKATAEAAKVRRGAALGAAPWWRPVDSLSQSVATMRPRRLARLRVRRQASDPARR